MLTDAACRSAKTKAKTYKLTDGNGLFLEVTPSGSKHWRYRFELGRGEGAKESVYAIGHYGPAPSGETPAEGNVRRASGVFTLAEAREERTKARALVKGGVNPAHDRNSERLKRDQEALETFEALARMWVAARPWAPRTNRQNLRMLENTIFPKIGALPIRKITPAHCLAVMNTVRDENGPTVANKARATMSAVFDLAVATLRADANPVYPVRKALPAHQTAHKRPLPVSEVGELLRAVDNQRSVRFDTRSALHLVWWTLCRSNEVIGAEWSEFDLEAGTWRIQARRMKKRKEHFVALPRQAVEMLKLLKELNGKGTHVFPNRNDPDRPAGASALANLVESIGWKGRFSPHAARTTGSTQLHAMGFSPDWIERQLSHVDDNAVRRAYNHADHFGDRAKMMQQWADLLDTWTKATSAPVKKTSEALP